MRTLDPLSQRWVLTWAVMATLGAATSYSLSRFQAKAQQSAPAAPRITAVSALGRIEPSGQVSRLVGPSGIQGARVAELLVEQGDAVKGGQVIAVLDNRDRLAMALATARKQVQTEQARLAQVRAGAKQGEILAQQATIGRVDAQWQGDRSAQVATIARLEAQLQGERMAQQATITRLRAEVNNAEAEFQRHQTLANEGAISASLLDGRRLQWETQQAQLAEAEATLVRIETTGIQQLSEARATLTRIEGTGRKQLSQAQATLTQIAEVRPVDVRIAEAAVEQAEAEVAQAKANLETAYVRAPKGGRILRVYARAGEAIGTEGIVTLGQTQQMMAVAEVYESDIRRVRLGQKATIRGDAFDGELQGSVSLIGSEVAKQDVLGTDPVANTDARVVEVRIRLDPASSAKVADLTNTQVTASIQL